MGLKPQTRAAVDRKIDEAVGLSKVRAKLDFRYSEGKNWKPYERYLLKNGHTIFVNLAGDPVTVTVSEEPNPKAVKKVEKLEAKRADKVKRKADREAKKAERAAEPKVKKAAKPKKEEPKGQAGWSDEEWARIQQIMEKGCSRKEAIQRFRKEQKAAPAVTSVTFTKKVVDPLAQATAR